MVYSDFNLISSSFFLVDFNDIPSNRLVVFWQSFSVRRLLPYAGPVEIPETEDHLFVVIVYAGVYETYLTSLPHCELVRGKGIRNLVLSEADDSMTK